MRRAAVLTLLVVLATVTPFAGTATAQEDQVTLTVTVVNQEEQTIGGATVTATFEGGSRNETTASNGKAFIDVPRGADVELDIEDDRYVRNFPKEVDDAGNEDVTVRVARKGSAVVSITEEGDQPVRNATVFIEEQGGQQRIVAQGRTNSDGRFTSGTIEQGEYTIALLKSGYFNNETTISVTGDVLREYEMRKGSVNVNFVVRDDHFENPRAVNDATVTVRGTGSQRTTNGRVTFTLPVNTRQEISVTKEGYQANNRSLDVGESGRDVRVFIQRTPELNLTASSNRVLVGNRVTVSVTNAYDEPVKGAEISYDGEAVGDTDSAGEQRIRVESAGNHTVLASTGDLTSPPVTIEGVDPDAQTPTPSPTPSPTATPTPTPTPTATPTPTPSPTATPEPSPSPTASPSPEPSPSASPTAAVGLPGFTPAIAVLSLLVAALVLARRRD